MNYRHIYHAGNHADVLKHIVMMRALLHLKKKDKPFLFLDAHAGTGLYALWGDEALKTLEWQDGVGRFYDPSGRAVPLDSECESLLEPWRQVIAAVNSTGQPLSHYPGSPGFALQAARESDRLLLNELHPEDHDRLTSFIAGDKRVMLSEDDAAVVVKAHLPPPERRGFILIDPPYEREDEARRAVKMLRDGHRRFATGAFALWYPVTGDGLVFVTGGYPPVRPIYAIRAGATGDISLKPDQTGNDYIVWSNPTLGPFHPSALVYGGCYYTLLDRGLLSCNDPGTGKEIYPRQRISVDATGFTASPWAYNGKVFAMSEDGDTYVIQAGAEFKVLGKNSLEEMTLASPAVANGSLIVRTASKLYRIGRP